MEKEERRNRKFIFRSKELLVWCVILLLAAVFGVLLYIRHENSFETHSIYMPDVDGLIVGSPVHIMGIPIGYVTKTKIVNENEIRVKFKVTNKNVHISQGTIATVEFTGLGGSKSLELYPPGIREPNEIVGKNDYIVVDRPKRLRDSMALLYEMYNTFMDIINTTTTFGNKVCKIEKSENIKTKNIDVKGFLDFADEYIDYYSNNMKTIRKMIDKTKK